ncbi:hypothetical protein BH11ACT4_BH11ACT4_08330 [soil metagenome]
MLNDLAVGDRLDTEHVVVDGPSMKVFSVIMKDPNPIHFDPVALEQLGLGSKPVNQGTINMAYPINALLRLVESPAQLTSFRCRFQGNLFAGDELVVDGIVTAVDDETVSIDVWVERTSDGQRAVSGSAVLARA